MKKWENFLTTAINCLVIAAGIWCLVTNTIQAFKHPELTQTELFLRIPKSFVLNFE